MTFKDDFKERKSKDGFTCVGCEVHFSKGTFRFGDDPEERRCYRCASKEARLELKDLENSFAWEKELLQGVISTIRKDKYKQNAILGKL